MTPIFSLSILLSTGVGGATAAQERAPQDRSAVEAQQIEAPSVRNPSLVEGSAATRRSDRREATDAPEQLSSARGGTDAPAQISSSGQSTGALPQLSPRSDRRSTQQLYRGGPTAEPTEALSRPSEGRTAAVSRVEGEDRCDPAEGRQRASSACARVIETRSAEFVRTESVLSPEQRLLIEQRNQTMMGDQGAARRLAGRAGGNPDDLEDQSIASVALGPGAPAARSQEGEQPAELSAETRAMVEAIVTRLVSPQ